MIRTITIDDTKYEYEFVRKRIKNMNLRIRHDGTIYVSCGMRTPIYEVERFLKEKKDFILKGLKKTEDRIRNQSRPSEYITGEIVKIFGEKCVIRVFRATGRRPCVVFEYPSVDLYVKDPDSFEDRKRIYETWRKRMLKDKVLEMCDYYYPLFQTRGVKKPCDIKFRSMTSKWGCCRPKDGTLTFNYNLFELPEEVIAYVVVHEFAHFLQPNHSQRFYKEVARVMPDYAMRRIVLNEY